MNVLHSMPTPVALMATVTVQVHVASGASPLPAATRCVLELHYNLLTTATGRELVSTHPPSPAAHSLAAPAGLAKQAALLTVTVAPAPPSATALLVLPRRPREKPAPGPLNVPAASALMVTAVGAPVPVNVRLATSLGARAPVRTIQPILTPTPSVDLAKPAMAPLPVDSLPTERTPRATAGRWTNPPVVRMVLATGLVAVDRGPSEPFARPRVALVLPSLFQAPAMELDLALTMVLSIAAPTCAAAIAADLPVATMPGVALIRSARAALAWLAAPTAMLAQPTTSVFPTSASMGFAAVQPAPAVANPVLSQTTLVSAPISPSTPIRMMTVRRATRVTVRAPARP